MSEAATDPGGPSVDSPCVGVCAIDETSGHCAGCARTIDEIVRWGRMPRDERRVVLAAAAERRAVRDGAGGDSDSDADSDADGDADGDAGGGPGGV